MPNLKKKYWHGPKGSRLANEISEQDLKDLTAVEENISNQKHEPSEAMNIYISQIPNNTFKKAVDKVINNASSQDIQATAEQNLSTEGASTD
jgi:hypothetical protein